MAGQRAANIKILNGVRHCSNCQFCINHMKRAFCSKNMWQTEKGGDKKMSTDARCIMSAKIYYEIGGKCPEFKTMEG